MDCMQNHGGLRSVSTKGSGFARKQRINTLKPSKTVFHRSLN
jgi:hypothetical protein